MDLCTSFLLALALDAAVDTADAAAVERGPPHFPASHQQETSLRGLSVLAWAAVGKGLALLTKARRPSLDDLGRVDGKTPDCPAAAWESLANQTLAVDSFGVVGSSAVAGSSVVAGSFAVADSSVVVGPSGVVGSSVVADSSAVAEPFAAADSSSSSAAAAAALTPAKHSKLGLGAFVVFDSSAKPRTHRPRLAAEETFPSSGLVLATGW